MLTFNKNYFLVSIVLFIIEVVIALYMNDTIIRPYFGDFLVVILVYSFIKSFFLVPVFSTAVGVLLFAFLVELLQYLNLIKWLGLQHSRLANVVLGNYFEWIDILAYTLGILFVLFIEKRVSKKPLTT